MASYLIILLELKTTNTSASNLVLIFLLVKKCNLFSFTSKLSHPISL